MVLHDPAHARHRRLHAHLQHRRLRIGRLRQRHALRRLGDAERSGHGRGRAATAWCSRRGRLTAGRARLRARFYCGYGRAALRLERHPAGATVPRHPRDRRSSRSPARPSCRALGGQHGQSPRDLLGRRTRPPTIWRGSGRCSRTIRSFPSAPTSRWRRCSRPTTSCCMSGSAARGSRAPAARPPARRSSAASRKGLTGRRPPSRCRAAICRSRGAKRTTMC